MAGSQPLPEQTRFDFTGHIAVVTGAGKGIGRGTALALARAGAEVIAISRTAKDLETLREEIGCRTLQADLADAEATVNAAC
jgi:NAD(P)-dependent dehydrogenase (short-subunit alcohol dehydrogenase family)